MKRSLPFFFLLLMALPMWASHPVCVSNRAVEGASGTMVIKQKNKAKSRIHAPKGYKIPAPKGYKLVWHDEFSGTALGKDWMHELKPAGWVNQELQTYVNDEKVTQVYDGTLKINLRQEGDRFLSGRVYAKRHSGWQYGYIEARIKLPEGHGTWPAFWMMPVKDGPWPGNGEIDIMEAVGHTPNVIYSTIHCSKYNNGGTPIEHGYVTIEQAADFHVYSMEWTAHEMTFYVDGQKILSYQNDGTGRVSWPFDQPFYIILNLAWGGQWGGQKGVDNSLLPLTMEVDYVRVFQKR